MIHALVTLALGLATIGQAPPPGDGPPDGERPRRPSREEWAQRGRDMREAYMKASPAERRAMRLDRFTDMVERTYELSGDQRRIVRDEMGKIQTEYYARMGDKAGEFERLENEMAEFWMKQAAQGADREERPWDRPEFRALRDRMRAIEREFPFDRDAAVRRVEALLPAEQVATGQKRREEWRERMAQVRDRGPGGRRGREGRGERGERIERGPGFGPRRGADAPAPQAVETPEHPWEAYVREFEQRHDLDAAQRAAAKSVLKDLLERERNYRHSRSTQFAEAGKLPSASQREARLKELNMPVDELFTELKNRLDDLLTAEQRGMP